MKVYTSVDDPTLSIGKTVTVAKDSNGEMYRVITTIE